MSGIKDNLINISEWMNKWKNKFKKENTTGRLGLNYDSVIMLLW